MERRLDHLEERLRALDGALRLRGIWTDAQEAELCDDGAPLVGAPRRVPSGSGEGVEDE